jgi:hypothetical protein
VDIGGHSPIPLGPPPLLLSVFQFPHSLLFLAVFRVLNFQSRFEALNDIFLGKREAKWIIVHVSHPKVVVLGQIFLTRYRTRQTEIVCQSYVPGKLMYQLTQTGPIVLAFHLLGLGLWMFRVFHCFSIIICLRASLEHSSEASSRHISSQR